MNSEDLIETPTQLDVINNESFTWKTHFVFQNKSQGTQTINVRIIAIHVKHITFYNRTSSILTMNFHLMEFHSHLINSLDENVFAFISDFCLMRLTRASFRNAKNAW